jgi:UDP-N-acetylmuramyl pentapeptide phosphotransferase/UDP-N-acetylglucosamine-1-phosphate transferase
MEYLSIFVLLVAAELLYFRIAKHYNIIDKPNERSSHTQITLRGGGIIFWISAALYTIFNPSTTSIWFLVGMTIISGVSFRDDVKGVNQKIRLIFHLFAMTCVFYLAGVFVMFPWWAIVMGYIVFIGIVNAYNFMDGINGITGLYTLAVLLPIIYVNESVEHFVSIDFIIYPTLASVVFLFFNFRKKARCFAGDVGSVGIAFWVVTLLLLLMIKTHNLIWIGFLFVYGVDTVCTILHRIYLKQNIMEAHRLHFYQILVNECGISHLRVSIIYFIVQLACSAAIILFYPLMGWGIFFILSVVLVAIYSLKFKLMKQEKS